METTLMLNTQWSKHTSSQNYKQNRAYIHEHFLSEFKTQLFNFIVKLFVVNQYWKKTSKYVGNNILIEIHECLEKDLLNNYIL